MAYLSKQNILSAYRQLSKLTSDPSAQGATQATSSLRYLFALVRFYNQYNRPCNTRLKSDREKFIEYVGEVVAINNSHYTGNFYNSIKDDEDYKVGSNFFSVNTVKTSLENSEKDYDFPKRGNTPLFIVRNGELILKSEYFKHLGAVLYNSKLCSAFAIWLVRNIDIDTTDPYASIKQNLIQEYSSEIVSVFFPERANFTNFEAWSFVNEPAILDISDFPKQKKEDAPENNQTLLSPEELIKKVRDCFIKYWELIDQHGADYASYVANFESAINPYLVQLDLGYANVFQIVEYDVYSSIISEIISKYPDMEYLSEGRKNVGVKYSVSSTHLHFKNYLQILSISDFRANIEQVKNKTLAIQSKTTALDFNKYLRAMRTKPFLLLAGISGTGKSRIVKQLAYKSCPNVAALRRDTTSPGNYCLVEVKPNWHDSTELLGYTSYIGHEHYVVTKFVQFVAKAMLYPEVPFFLCLDEMNLAPVEQYFAEFLSVLESRKVKNGHITSEPLIPASIFTQYENTLKLALFDIKVEKTTRYDDANMTSEDAAIYGRENEIYDRLKADGLRIPENLIVIGTVNMDETTHQFSRKVIDRAMTIEMNIEDGEEPFTSFFEDYEELAYTDTPLTKELFLPRFVSADESLRDRDTSVVDLLKAEVPTLLGQLNQALNGTPFKIAYRVQNELILYFNALLEDSPEETPENLLTKALDDILIMKVLPRIEGDEDTLKKPLNELHDYTNRLHLDNSKAKIEEMQEHLDRGHFTSFWP